VTARTRPLQRHWRSYGTDPLPTPAEVLGEPLRAFPSWFLRVECDRCSKDQRTYRLCGRMCSVIEPHNPGLRGAQKVQPLGPALSDGG
jgi:hypothetical protein